MAAGITDHGWTVQELLSFHVPPPRWTPPKQRGRPSHALKRLIERWCGDHGSMGSYPTSDDHHPFFLGFAKDTHDLMEVLAQCLGVKMGHDCIEDAGCAIWHSPNDVEQDPVRIPVIPATQSGAKRRCMTDSEALLIGTKWLRLKFLRFCS